MLVLGLNKKIGYFFVALSFLNMSSSSSILLSKSCCPVIPVNSKTPFQKALIGVLCSFFL